MKYGSYEEQVKDDLSIYNYYRQAVRLRRIFPAISRGQITEIAAVSADYALYLKEAEGYEPVLIAINFSNEKVVIEIPDGYSSYSVLGGVLNTSKDKIKLGGGKITLPAYDIAVITEG